MPNAVIIAPEDQKQITSSKQKRRKDGFMVMLFSILISAALFTTAYFLSKTGDTILLDTAAKGIAAGMDAYEKSKEQTAGEVYQSYYDNSYAYAEKKNHVSN